MYERRRYARTYAQRHADGYDYSIEIEGQYYNAQLLDISRGGAKVKLVDSPEYNYTGKYGTVKDDYYDYQYLKGMDYTVVWSQGSELGIAFQEPLAEHTGALGYYSSYRA